MARKTAPDWEAIKRDYRTGQFSDRELSRIHGVGATTIRDKARNRKWERDLSGQVQAETLNQLSRDAEPRTAAHCAQQTAHSARPDLARVGATPPADNAAAVAPDDATIVQAAARRGADVVRGHRAGAARLRAQLDRLGRMVDARLDWLEAMGSDEDLAVAQAAEALEGQPHGGALNRRSREFGVIECAELLDTMARTFARLAATERQAFNLDGKPGAAPPGLEDDERRILTGDQRIAALMALRTRAMSETGLAAASAVH